MECCCCTVVSGKAPHCRVTTQHTQHRSESTQRIGQYIASSVAQVGSCGSESKPWHVQAAPGQKLRFTLHDFAVQPAAAAAAAAAAAVTGHLCL